jgi:MFS family permease
MKSLGLSSLSNSLKIFTPKEELKIFYFSIALYNLAISLVQIFIPIYLFKKGFSFSSILLFFALSQLGRLLFLPLAAHLSSFFGAKKIIVIAFVFQAIYFFFLQKIDYFSVGFWGSVIFYGAIWAFLYLPCAIHFSKIAPNEKRGKIIGQINSYSAIFSAAGPLLGGIIIFQYGFNYVFLLSILIIVPAITLLLSTPEVSKIRKINFSLVKIKKVYPDLIANGFFNFQTLINFIMWPLFIFIIIPQYQTIGFIQTISLFISLIAFNSIGKLTDKFNRNKLLFIGSVLNGITGSLRILANSPLKIFLFNTISIFTGPLQAFSWTAKLQEHLDQEVRTEYMTLFEIGGTLITIIGLAGFIFLSRIMPFKEILIYGIIAGSLSGMFINIVRK